MLIVQQGDFLLKSVVVVFANRAPAEDVLNALQAVVVLSVQLEQRTAVHRHPTEDAPS